MRIHDLARRQALISSTASVLGWDQETMMPPAGAKHRAAQLGWLSGQAHALATSDEWRAALEEAETDDDGSDPKSSANLKEMRRLFDRATKLPVELVSRATTTASLAKHAWAEARKTSDFGMFAPHLADLLSIACEKAERWGYCGEPYDALLDGYERGATTAGVAELFTKLEPELIGIARQAVGFSEARKPSLPPGPYPVQAQIAFNRRLAEEIGFDFSAGRIDPTAHPFCSRVGAGDVRLTTRYDEADFTSSLLAVLHEAGHGLYEQGLPQEDLGLPSGSSASLGVHESQSRMFENHVGRSRAFWERWHPLAVEHFPQLAQQAPEDFLAFVQRSAFTEIRVEAPETTYDLHILLRFDLERRLLNGELAVADLPAAWNEGFRARFGFSPSDDSHGCLQDIHWAMGALGYFPTYTLGNLNASALYAAARRDPDVAAACDRADYGPLLAWMRRHIHAHGATLDPSELLLRATGGPATPEPYLAHLRTRTGPVA